jgi:hypothetical protein
MDHILRPEFADPWRANLLRVLAIGAAKNPQELAAATAMPVYPLPPNDILFTLSRHNCDLADENAWASGQIDRLHSENEALRRELDALRAEADVLRAHNSQLRGENNALIMVLRR